MYARGARAWGHCQRCGQRYKRNKLKREWTNLFVCGPCFDPEPGDLRPPKAFPDPMAIQNALPDADDASDAVDQLSTEITPTHT